MATGTLRIILVVLALVVGGVVLAQAFPSAEAGVGQAADSTVSPNGTTETTPAQTGDGGEEAQGGDGGGGATAPQDASIMVLNGTDETGLAERTAEDVMELGYESVEYGDADQDSEETVIFYKQEFREVALDLKRGLGLGQVPMSRATGEEDVPDVTVLLGADYAETGG